MTSTTDIGSRIFAAVSALAISAILLATAIVPATPQLGMLV
ncbi:MAG: hypothetical protein AAGK02_04565 [Pseudomonadota bacterium]